MDIKELAEYITSWRQHHGFFTPSNLDTELDRDMMLGKLMLVVSEVSEAAEAVRHNDKANFVEELADTLIRLFDIMHTCGLDIETEMRRKMAVNETRPLKHGKFCSL